MADIFFTFVIILQSLLKTARSKLGVSSEETSTFLCPKSDFPTWKVKAPILAVFKGVLGY